MKTTEQDRKDGSPCHAQKLYIDIKFQSGPKTASGTNGCDIQDVIAVLIDRLDGLQRGPFACRANAGARRCLYLASVFLHARTQDRKARGVEGKDEP